MALWSFYHDKKGGIHLDPYNIAVVRSIAIIFVNKGNPKLSREILFLLIGFLLRHGKRNTFWRVSLHRGCRKLELYSF